MKNKNVLMYTVYQKTSYLPTNKILKHYLACCNVLKLSTIQAQCFLQHRLISTKTQIPPR